MKKKHVKVLILMARLGSGSLVSTLTLALHSAPCRALSPAVGDEASHAVCRFRGMTS